MGVARSAEVAPASCPRCGGTLVPRTETDAEGFCPACLFGQAIASGDKALDEASSDAGDWMDALETDSDIPVPSRNFGKYELLEQIARGGMGIVYRARQKVPERIVALKIILPQQAALPGMIERFRSEVEVVASVDHPNILPVFEAGERDGLPFFSMKFAAGGTLERRMAAYAYQPREAARLMILMARAVHHAHERGILHCDLKPGNILLGADNEPFVSDFGISKWIDRENALTQTVTAIGTPAYAAPEQLSGTKTELTIAADVYGLGAIFYHLLAQRPPFAADTPLETLRRAVDDPPLPLRALNRELPRDLEVICLKCLAKDPSARYGSASAFADDLNRWLEGRTILARPSTSFEKARRWARRNRAVATLLAACLALLLATAIGSMIAALRIARARDRAVEAEREGREKLWDSYLIQARASRLSGRAGQRFESMAAVEKAARIHPNLAVRNAAIAALALCDVRVERTWPRLSSQNATLAFDEKMERYACEREGGSIAICRVADQKEIARLPGSGARIEYIYGFSSDGKYLAAKLIGGETWMWRLEDRRPLLKLQGRNANGLGWSAFSDRTGLFAFARPNGGVEVYRLADLAADSEKVAAPWRHWTEPPDVQGLAFDPTGTKLAISDIAQGERAPESRARSGGVEVRETESGQSLWKFPNAEGISTAYWNSDGTMLAASSWDRTVHLLDAKTGAELRILRGHRDDATVAKFNHAGSRIASLGLDGRIIFFDVSSEESLVWIPNQEPTFSYSPDDRHLGVTVDDETIGLLEFADTDVFRALRPANNPGRPLNVAASPDGTYIATSGFTGSVIWSVPESRVVVSLASPEVRATSSAFVQRNGALVFLVGDDISGYSRRTLQRKGGQNDQVEAGLPKSWLKESGWTMDGISSNGQFAALAPRSPRHRGPMIVAIDDPTHRVELIGARGAAGVVFNRDGKLIASGSHAQDGVTVWNAAGEVQQKFEANENAVAAFDPNGRWLVTGTRHGYRLWGLDQWQAGPELDHGDSPGTLDSWAAAFSPDGKYLATLQAGGNIGLFDAASGTSLATLEAPFPISPEFLFFSPDSRWINVLGVDQTLQRWDLPTLRAQLGPIGLAW